MGFYDLPDARAFYNWRMIKEKLGRRKKKLSYAITTLIDSLFIFQNNIN